MQKKNTYKAKKVPVKIKHYMIQWNVLGQVSNFHFRVDESLVKNESVVKIIHSLQLSKTPHQKDIITEIRITNASKGIVLQKERKWGIMNKKLKDLFFVNQSKLNEKNQACLSSYVNRSNVNK